jgi:hypothetical protein
MSIQLMESAADEDQVRLRLRTSLLEYLERNVEHHDQFEQAVRGGTAHTREAMGRLAGLLARRDAALVAHLDLLATTGRCAVPVG